MPENLAALRAGDIEVMQAFQPFVEQAVEDGVGHIWYAAASRGLTAYTSLYTTRQHMARDPESLLHMTRAMYRTQQWIATHSAAELAACVAAFFPDLPYPYADGSPGALQDAPCVESYAHAAARGPGVA